MKRHKVYVVGGDILVEELYQRHDKKFELVDSVVDADIVQFTGGADVSPELYGESNVRSYCDAGRDNFEQKIFDQAYKLGKAMVGICRGGQFLNVMNGGKMWQHVNNHTTNHMVFTSWSKGMCTSTHHQMMRPSSAGQVIGFAKKATTFLHDGKDVHKDVDTEIVWYDISKCLCFQPHPEYHFGGYTEQLFFECLERYVL